MAFLLKKNTSMCITYDYVGAIYVACLLNIHVYVAKNKITTRSKHQQKSEWSNCKRFFKKRIGHKAITLLYQTLY